MTRVLKQKCTDIDSALADLGIEMEPKRPDEWTVEELAKKSQCSAYTVLRRLKLAQTEGKWDRRKIGSTYYWSKK